jgi:glycosyltransferase involved in cell wall biosynthesis
MAMQTQQLAALLERDGAQITLIAVNPPYRPAWIAQTRGVRAVARLIPYLIRLWRRLAEVQLVHVMANSGWSWHMFAAPAIWIARMRGVPVIVNYRGGEAARFLQSQPLLLRSSLNAASRLIVPSGYLSSIFREHGFASDIIPNIVDTERFKPVNDRRMNAPHLVVTRNLERIYDIGTALEAFRVVRQSFPNASMTVAGSGPERENLERVAAQLDISDAVLFTGALNREQIAELYRSADVAVNPSIVDNMPNSVMEAMAAGVPVVSTNAGGVPFIISSGQTGLLVPPGEPLPMARAILRILAEPELRARLSTAARAQAEQWSWRNVSARWLSAYREVVDHRARAPSKPMSGHVSR